jgi:hypothetical protein
MKQQALLARQQLHMVSKLARSFFLSLLETNVKSMALSF